MSMAILKSPTLIHQRLTLGADRSPSGAAAIEIDPRVAIEAQVRAELEAQYLAQYQAQLDAIKDDARAEGYKEGLATGHHDGMASAMDAFKKKQALLEQVLKTAEEQIEDWMQSMTSQAFDLAKDAVCQFVGEHALNAAVLQNIVKRVSAGLREADVLSIRMYPVDCNVLRSALKQSASGQAISRLADKLVEDSSMEAGGIAIDTPRGEYRATLDVQLKKLMALVDQQRQDALNVAPSYHALRA